MNNPLNRYEKNFVKSHSGDFHRFMGSMRYKGGIENIAGVRLFIVWFKSGKTLKLSTVKHNGLHAPIGDTTRHQRNKRALDLAGVDMSEGLCKGKFVPIEKAGGWTEEDLIAKELSAKEAAALSEQNSFERKKERATRAHKKASKMRARLEKKA